MNNGASLLDTLPLPQIYYDVWRKDYWAMDGNGKWILLNEQNARLRLVIKGFSKEGLNGKASPVDQALYDIQQEQNVDYAAPLAGYPAGLYTMGEQRILVTNSPRLIQPEPMPYPLIGSILERMLVDRQLNVDQRPYLYGWLHNALTCLYERKFAPGQALALAGARDSGKSLVQQLITVMFGGRAAKPHQFMQGETPFNADLFGNEHLMIEDDSASTDIRARRHLGSHLKQVTANRDQRCHDKGKRAVVLRPFWRLTITVNDEPGHLMVLPPMDESIEDKIIILNVTNGPMPMPTSTPEEKEMFMAALLRELPGFVFDMLHYSIPAELRSARYGIKHYHHPVVLDALEELSPEKRLKGIILAYVEQSTAVSAIPREFTSEVLEQKLTAKDSPVDFQARRLFSYANACGTYLGRLAKSDPEFISSKKVHGQTVWACPAIKELGMKPHPD